MGGLFTGEVDGEEDLVSILNYADFLAVPSREDNLPNVIVEGMACGIPVLASAVGGIPEMIQDGRNGWLMPSHSLTDLCHGFMRAMGDPRRTVLAQQARLDAVDRYASHRIAALYQACYEEVYAQWS